MRRSTLPTILFDALKYTPGDFGTWSEAFLVQLPIDLDHIILTREPAERPLPAQPSAALQANAVLYKETYRQRNKLLFQLIFKTVSSDSATVSLIRSEKDTADGLAAWKKLNEHFIAKTSSKQ